MKLKAGLHFGLSIYFGLRDTPPDEGLASFAFTPEVFGPQNYTFNYFRTGWCCS
jgi:hypothetical protein